MDDRCHLRRQGYASGGYPVLRFLAIAKGDNGSARRGEADVPKLFLSNRSQAVRIPANLRLPEAVKDVEVRAWGTGRELKQPTNRILETIGGLSG
jgi:hypothetical protein